MPNAPSRQPTGPPESALNRCGSQLFDVRHELLNRLRTEQPIIASCQFDQTAEKTRQVPINMIGAGDAFEQQQPRIHTWVICSSSTCKIPIRAPDGSSIRSGGSLECKWEDGARLQKRRLKGELFARADDQIAAEGKGFYDIFKKRLDSGTLVVGQQIISGEDEIEAGSGWGREKVVPLPGYARLHSGLHPETPSAGFHLEPGRSCIVWNLPHAAQGILAGFGALEMERMQVGRRYVKVRQSAARPAHLLPQDL